MQKGNASILFEKPPAVSCWGCIAGKKEAEGPLGDCFDVTGEDALFGEKTWEAAESRIQKEACILALGKAKSRAGCPQGGSGAAGPAKKAEFPVDGMEEKA